MRAYLPVLLEEFSSARAVAFVPRPSKLVQNWARPWRLPCRCTWMPCTLHSRGCQMSAASAHRHCNSYFRTTRAPQLTWVCPVTRMSQSSLRCRMASASLSPQGTTCQMWGQEGKDVEGQRGTTVECEWPGRVALCVDGHADWGHGYTFMHSTQQGSADSQCDHQAPVSKRRGCMTRPWAARGC